MDRPLNLETRVAAITSSISAAWMLPATRALEQQGQGLHQGRGGGVGGGAQQLNPPQPLLHKFRHRGRIAEVELAGGAEHHHPPALDTRLLLQSRALSA